MGFRNPITSLSASQITPGTLLGSVIQTAASGKRVRITSTPTNRVEFYTGDPDETSPGIIDSGEQGAGASTIPWITLRPPMLTGKPQAEMLRLRGNSRDWAVQPEVQLTAPLRLFAPLIIDRPVVMNDSEWRPIDGPGEPPFENGWTNFNPSWAPAAFRRMPDGTVALRGTISSGALGTICTLVDYNGDPMGPPMPELFITRAGAGFAFIRVFTTGVVDISAYGAGGTNTVVSLSGIRFSNTG